MNEGQKQETVSNQTSMAHCFLELFKYMSAWAQLVLDDLNCISLIKSPISPLILNSPTLSQHLWPCSSLITFFGEHTITILVLPLLWSLHLLSMVGQNTHSPPLLNEGTHGYWWACQGKSSHLNNSSHGYKALCHLKPVFEDNGWELLLHFTED